MAYNVITKVVERNRGVPPKAALPGSTNLSWQPRH